MSDTLLLADDSVTMQRVVELTFAEQGLNVVSVSDGQQAIDYITTHRPALALISVTLQRVSGFDVARYVRDHAEEHKLPVLLLAGAFDTINDAQVRESGASGVLVKPFEPALVIKRVKELLGMSKADAARPARPSSSGRLITSSEGPVRPELADADATTVEAAPPTAEDPSWAHGRAQTGLEPGPSPADARDSGGDYLKQLDAAFDSLDAQLAGREAASPSASPTPFSSPAADRNPVFEVDDNWFGQKSTSADVGGGEFVVTRASDYVSTPAAPTSAPASASASVDEDRSWAPPGGQESVGTTSGRNELSANYGAPTATVTPDGSTPQPTTSTAGREEFATSFSVPSPLAPSPAPVSVHESSAIYNPPSSGRPVDQNSGPATLATPPGASAPDAFAMLWAHEQGEPVPLAPPPAPLELSEATITAVAAELSAGIANRVVGGLAERLTGSVADRVAGPLADRLGDTLANRVTTGVAERVIAGVVDPVTAGLADRVSVGLAERVGGAIAPALTSGVAERVGVGLAGQIGHGLAERLGDQLAERLAADLATRITGTLADRLTSGLADQITAGIADRIAPMVADRVAPAVAERIAPSVADRVAPVVAERMTTALGDRLSSGLPERMSELLAERMMQNTFGDALRQTVNEVAERLVRAEIERIRAAASPRPS